MTAIRRVAPKPLNRSGEYQTQLQQYENMPAKTQPRRRSHIWDQAQSTINLMNATNTLKDYENQLGSIDRLGNFRT